MAMIEPRPLIHAATAGVPEAYAALAAIATAAGERSQMRANEARVAAGVWDRLRTVLVTAAAGEELGPEEQVLCEAAHGDTHALGRIANNLLASIDDRVFPYDETLTAVERFLALGAATGDRTMCQRFVGILYRRAEHEIGQGRHDLGECAAAEATVLLSTLVDLGDESMIPWLNMVAADVARPSVAIAIQHRPSILFHVRSRGAC